MTELSRRQALAGLGSVGLGALLAGCGSDEQRTGTTATTAAQFSDTSNCALTPQETEGPYYFDADAVRSDIREDRKGTRLRLAVRVRDAACKPIRDAVVDIWHCDAEGSYSGFQQASGERFLRGVQPTNSDGIAEFTTVYPGWYQGRTVHIHAKIHLDRTTVLTTQFYFDEAITKQVYAREPYASRSGRQVFNDGDQLYDERLLLKLSRDGDGWRGLFATDVSEA